MTLRPATPMDAPALARIHIQAWRETYQGIVSNAFLAQMSVPKREESWRSHLLSPGSRFDFVAEENGEPLGFCSGGPLRADWGSSGPFAMSFPPHLKSAYDGEFYAAYLLRAFQRRGIGRAMFEGVKSGLKERGFDSMLVWVLAENPATQFYQAMGGIEAGRTRIMIDRELENIAYGWEKI